MGLPLQMAGSILIFSQTAESDGRTAIPSVNLFFILNQAYVS